jgi:predicted HTH transcriptional regulator
MPLVLAPSFDDHTREQVEAHLEQVRIRRLAGALEYQQSKLLRLEKDNNSVTNKLIRNYEQMGKALMRLDKDLEKIEGYLAACQMLKTEADLNMDRITLAKRK